MAGSAPIFSFLFTSLVVLTSPACRQVAGIDERHPIAEECATCLASRCPAEGVACNATYACKFQAACMENCSVDQMESCTLACLPPLPASDYLATASHLRCRSANCQEACLESPGDLPLMPAQALAPACADCVATSCAQAARTCTGTAGCYETLLCSLSLPTPDGVGSCSAKLDAPGTKVYDDLFTCVDKFCTTACGRGNHWSCVGNVTWPQAHQEAVTVHLAMQSFPLYAPVPDLDVKLCLIPDFACAAPSARGKTDPQGRIAFTLPTQGQSGLTGVPGYFIDVSDATGVYLPTLYFFTPPVTQSDAVVPIPVPNGLLLNFAPDLGADLSLSLVWVGTRDCLYHKAGNVSISTDADADSSIGVRYTKSGSTFLPAGATETDSSGGALIYNVPALTSLTVMGRLKTASVPFGEAIIFTRPGTVSALMLLPSP